MKLLKHTNCMSYRWNVEIFKLLLWLKLFVLQMLVVLVQLSGLMPGG